MESSTETPNPSRSRPALRVGLEVLAGAVTGWFLTNTFIHPNLESGDGMISGMYNYMKQYEYNTEGAIIGAIAVPLISLIARRIYSHE